MVAHSSWPLIFQIIRTRAIHNGLLFSFAKNHDIIIYIDKRGGFLKQMYTFEPITIFCDGLIILITTFFCSAFFFLKMRGIRLSGKKLAYLIGINTLIPLICQILGGNEVLSVKISFIILLCVSIIMFDRHNMFSSLPTAIISVGIAYALEYLSVIITSVILYLLGLKIVNMISTCLACGLQLLICVLLSRSKRINNAFSRFTDESHFGLGLLISSYVFAFSLLISFKSFDMNIFNVLFLAIPMALVGLILWIRSIVQRHYKNKLQDRMDEYTKQEIEDKDKHIEQLEAEVATLAKQLHRDNHLLSSLERSVQSLAECETEEQRKQIIEEIQTMCRERNELVTKEQQQNKILPSTGIALIDGSLSELYIKAAAHGIGFDLTVNEGLHYLVNNIISQTDLQTLLCDHIKDAIIAVESAGITDGRILITIDKNDGIFEIAIRDNGVDFDVDTLSKLGKEQVTTHANEGGSGIGFMTTFETLRKTKGSLSITEYEKKTPFSKSVVFTFDGLNRFIIRSYRKDELEKAIKRDEVLIVC